MNSWPELRQYLLDLLHGLPDWGVLALPLVAALLGAWILWRILRVLAWIRMWSYRRVGSRGERKAEALLQSDGYSILDRQVTRRHRIMVDGKPAEAVVRADLLVRRGGQTFVAEVKAGWIVSNPLHTATRRQLLEYEVVFDAHGVLLVDVPRKKIRRVEFDLAR